MCYGYGNYISKCDGIIRKVKVNGFLVFIIWILWIYLYILWYWFWFLSVFVLYLLVYLVVFYIGEVVE